MAFRTLGVHSSPHLSSLSKVLTDVANNYDLGASRDMIVHAFDPTDTPNWQKLPTIWHLFDGTTICLNMGRIYATMFSSFPANTMFGSNLKNYERVTSGDQLMSWRLVRGDRLVMPSQALDKNFPEFVDAVMRPGREAGYPHRTYKSARKQALNPQPVEKTHERLSGAIEQGWSYGSYNGTDTMLFNLIIGALMRECGYSVFNQQIVEADWFHSATGYQRNIITVFEELRIEYQQMMRLNGNNTGTARRFFRSAIPVTANTRAVIADMTRKISTATGEGMSAANIGLNSSLILGRVPVNTLLEFEIAKVKSTVEDYIDAPRISAMHEIWSEYIAIDVATEDDVMPLILKWQELFPSKKGGQNASSSVAPSPGSPADPNDPNAQPGGSQPGGGTPGAGSDPDKSEGEGSGAEGDEDGDGDGGDEDGGSNGAGDNVTEDDSFKNEPVEDASENAPQKLNEGKANKGGVATTKGHTFEGPMKDPDANDPGQQDDIIPLSSDSAANELEESADTIEPLQNADYAEHGYGPNDLTPSRVSFDQAKYRKPMNTQDAIDRGREIEPSAQDRNLAIEFSKALENLNIYDRGKFKRAQTTPPGRLKSRAMVQQAAERAMHLPASAKPWQRTVRTVDVNPPLTIGVMTDVSASQGWAERVSAELAWIFSHAVSKIGGRVACLTFGMGVTITQRPGELMHNAQVVRADNGGELFDMGAGTMDVMLNLVNGTGTRMLFVLTDGRFYVGNEAEKAALWVDTLVKKGVYVVWITPDPTAEGPVESRMSAGYGSTPCTPIGTIPVSAQDLKNARGEQRLIETSKLIRRVGQEVDKAVTIGKQMAHR